MIGKTTGGSVLAAFLLFAAPFAPAQVRAGQAHILSGPLVVSDGWPECTNLQTWTRDVMRLEKVEDAGETAQAKVFFRWLRLFSKMATGGMIQAHEGPYGKEQYVLDAHKNLFVYGWGYCDTHSRIAEAAWSEFKQDRSAAERVVVQHHDGGYHTMYRLRLDGRFGAFDARYAVLGQLGAQVLCAGWFRKQRRSHHQLLQPKDFRHNVATYRLDAPGLLRCNSLLIRY